MGLNPPRSPNLQPQQVPYHSRTPSPVLYQQPYYQQPYGQQPQHVPQSYGQQPQHYPPPYAQQPQYQQPQYQQPQYQPQPIPGYSTSPNPANGQPTSGPRLLHIYMDGHKNHRIMDSDKQTMLYKIQRGKKGFFSEEKPHVKIFSATTNAEVGTLTFHNWSSDIDLTLHSQPTTLKQTSLLRSAYNYNSPLTNSTYTWKSEGMMSYDMRCTDSQDRLMCRFDRSAWALKKEGKFELGQGVQGQLMDEFVVTGYAMVEYQNRVSKASAQAAGSAGGC